MSLPGHHPILQRVAEAGFVSLGWFRPQPADRLPAPDGLPPAAVLLIGNAGHAMFVRFRAERPEQGASLDAWTRGVIEPLAESCGAVALFPFDQPPLPFLTWARRGGGGHVSPPGLNIHPIYGLWHAYRAALIFAADPALPPFPTAPSPCDSCLSKPCLATCPVQAFTPRGYDVERCGRHLARADGRECSDHGCLARRSCPIGNEYMYSPDQMRFHMDAFRKARGFFLA